MSGAPLFYYETSFDYIHEKMYIKNFLKTLMAVLDTTLDICTDHEKILGIVEATLTDLLPEPDIKQRLAGIRENLIKNTDEFIIIDAVFLWQKSLRKAKCVKYVIMLKERRVSYKRVVYLSTSHRE